MHKIGDQKGAFNIGGTPKCFFFLISLFPSNQLLEGMVACQQQLRIAHEKEHGWHLELGHLFTIFEWKKHSNTGSTRVFHHLLECPFYIRCPKGKRLYTQWSYWRSEVSSLEKSALWRVSLNQPPCCLLLIERYLLFWKTNKTFGASWKTHMFCRKKKMLLELRIPHFKPIDSMSKSIAINVNHHGLNLFRTSRIGPL
jgi:hypothetical protein